MSRILTLDHLYFQYPNDSKLNRKVPIQIQYMALISNLTNNILGGILNHPKCHIANLSKKFNHFIKPNIANP
jgi:hypothetical protein